jgi:hypothetical protein
MNLSDINIDKYNQEEYNTLIESIFKITIFYYQMNNEAAYLWSVNFREELKDLDYYIIKIKEFVDNLDLKEEFTMHPYFKHPKMDLVGELDILSETKIIDIKFSNNLNIKHILQLFLYNMIVDTSFKKEYLLQLWNFHLGNIYNIKINRDEIPVFGILKTIARSMGRKMKNMIFLYDLETTGLAYANKKMDIIERHIEEYTTGVVASSGLVRPLNIPFIPFQITRLTGITKEMVDEKGEYANKISFRKYK